MSLSYTFQFIVGTTTNATRSITINPDERWTTLVDRCSEALEWARAKPGRCVTVVGPELSYTYIVQATVDSIARRFAPAPKVKAVTGTEWTDPWACLDCAYAQQDGSGADVAAECYACKL